MYERKSIVVNEEYVRMVPRIGYYQKSKNIAVIFKYKYLLFAAGEEEGRIYLFTNSLEQMGALCGHKININCLCAISNKIIAAESKDNRWGR